jgi:hypothetical protein
MPVPRWRPGLDRTGLLRDQGWVEEASREAREVQTMPSLWRTFGQSEAMRRAAALVASAVTT